MKTTTLILFLFFVQWSNGQVNRAAHWYFGYQAGIDFSSGQPVADTNGKLSSIEGCSSISDTLGNLLFYSNASEVWNRNHLPMLNSQGLIGDQSSLQSSLIVPKPGSHSLYYLFSTIGAINPGLRYSVIDMNLDAGLGAVTTSKNVLLHDFGTEELAGTMHCNATDYWVVSRKMVNDSLKFLSYLLTANGVQGPVISRFYLPMSLEYSVGDLTFSREGSSLCLSVLGKQAYLFDFDLQTGQLLMQEVITFGLNEQVYSNAFSPDGSKLYTTSWISGTNANCYVSQFDLTAANISASRIDLDSVDYSFGSPAGYGFIGQLNLAPDQRIYVSRWTQNGTSVNPDTYWTLDSLDAIHDPNLSGSSCNFQRNFLYLNHKPTQIGLPNFVSNFNSVKAPLKECDAIPLGVNRLSQDIYFEIYPNPFSVETTLKSSENWNNVVLKIHNSFGKLVKQMSDFSEREMKLYRDDLPAGIYFISLIRDNQIIQTEKLVIVD